MLDADQKSLFLDWLETHTASVIKVARAYTLNAEDCQDLSQEILLQAWKSLPSFTGGARPSTWFYRVALQTAMNWRRQDFHRRTRQQALLSVEFVEAHPADSPECIEVRETIDQLYRAIHQLPKSDAALVLMYLEQLSYREMSEVLGISEANVGVKLNRAKKVLGALIQGDCNGTR